MRDSGAIDLKTDTKNIVQKIQLHFEDLIYQDRYFSMKFFPWIRTNELKKQLIKEKYNDKHKHLTENDIRLFYKNIQLSQQNKCPFDLYKIEHDSTIVIMKNYNSHNTENGVINPYRIFDIAPAELTNLILNVQSGLNAGKKPRLAVEGTSGTYFLETNQKKMAGVYKPYDQEPYTPNNPRGYPGEVGSEGIRKGILSGQCATRQVAVYLLDAAQHFHGVPTTIYVQFYHPCFNFKQLCETPIVSQKQCYLDKAKTKHGSLQEFVDYTDVVGNLGSHQFSASQVHKIGILDLRIMNCDRNEANILVVKKITTVGKQNIKTISLVPIDHGLSFPDNFQIYEYQIVWMGYKQSRQPFSEKELKYIDSIDPVKNCQALRERLGFRQICLRNFRIGELFLKKLAKAGFSLYEIGKFAYREDDDPDWDEGEELAQERRPAYSELQKLVMEAEFIHNTVRVNGFKSTAEFQMGFSKNKRVGEQFEILNQMKDITSQDTRLGMPPLIKKGSKVKQTSIQKRQNALLFDSRRPRNISLPNLKKKASTKDRRLRKQKRQTKIKGEATKQKIYKWGQLFFHYIEQLIDRFVTRKLQLKNNQDKYVGGRGRLMSQDIGY